MRPALAIFSLFLFAVTPLNAQTFGLGGLTESRPVRAQVFGLGEVATVKPRLMVRPVATNKESLSVQAAPVVVSQPVAQPIAQPATICIDGRCYPTTQTRQVYQRQPLLRRWR